MVLQKELVRHSTTTFVALEGEVSVMSIIHMSTKGGCGSVSRLT
jgi:hypothetical protein